MVRLSQDPYKRSSDEVKTSISELEETEPSSAFKKQRQPSQDSLIAYCGLFCGDCIIRKGEIWNLSKELLPRLQTPEFRKLAIGLPQLTEVFEALQGYDPCCAMLEVIVDHLQCTTVCKQGGGSTDCQIRRCCQEKGIQGCWMCEMFEPFGCAQDDITCETLAGLNPIHQGAHLKNLRRLRDVGITAFLEGEKYW